MVLQDKSSHNSPDGRAQQAEIADYIARMAAELRALSARSDLGFLAYLLGMAEEEAARYGARRRDG